MPKNVQTLQNCTHPRASKIMLKILQGGFSNMGTWTSRFSNWISKRQEEPEIKLPISVGSLKKTSWYPSFKDLGCWTLGFQNGSKRTSWELNYDISTLCVVVCTHTYTQTHTKIIYTTFISLRHSHYLELLYSLWGSCFFVKNLRSMTQQHGRFFGSSLEM